MPCGSVAIVPRTGGFRKIRFARPTRTEGKSGGVRVVDYVVAREGLAFLFLVGPKRDADGPSRRLLQIADILRACSRWR